MLSSQLLAQPLSPVVELNELSYSDAQKNQVLAMFSVPSNSIRCRCLKMKSKMLRGQVEELSYQLQQLKQLQMDDYLDIDRRLTAISQSKVTILPVNNSENSILVAHQILRKPFRIRKLLNPKIVTPEDIEADYLASSKLLKETRF